MKYYLYIVAILTIFLGAGRAEAQQGHFFDALYDVPVMKGLIVLPEQALNYDKPEGRISQSIAYAPVVNWDSISLFYQESLAQMGWQKLADNKYVREGELLEIIREEKSDGGRNIVRSQGLIIKFLLRPQ